MSFKITVVIWSTLSVYIIGKWKYIYFDHTREFPKSGKTQYLEIQDWIKLLQIPKWNL